MNQIEIGKFIAALRKEQNMSQRQLAEKLNVTDRAVSKWENGRGLPDVYSMKSLCEVFDISIDELLNAQRNVSDDENKSNVLNLLLERELEIRKRKTVQKLCAALMTVTIILSCVVGTALIGMAVSGVRGEGLSLYTAVYTGKAQATARLIVNQNYKEAVKYIGFEGKERAKAQDNWVLNMEALSDEIEIEAMEISEIIYDDYYPLGKYFVTVSDYKSGARYVFDGQITIQDSGVVFGSIYISAESTDYRRMEVAELIENALCTWNAG